MGKKYRIKIVTYKTGRQEYFPQVKKGWYWAGIAYDGEAMIGCEFSCSTRQKALYNIDLHYEGNHEEQTIYFEYIEK